MTGASAAGGGVGAESPSGTGGETGFSGASSDFEEDGASTSAGVGAPAFALDGFRNTTSSGGFGTEEYTMKTLPNDRRATTIAATLSIMGAPP